VPRPNFSQQETQYMDQTFLNRKPRRVPYLAVERG
jgi:hypothetical protein